MDKDGTTAGGDPAATLVGAIRVLLDVHGGWCPEKCYHNDCPAWRVLEPAFGSLEGILADHEAAARKIVDGSFRGRHLSGRLRDEIARLLAAAQVAETERCVAICDRFVTERQNTRDRLWAEDGKVSDRVAWVECKRSEAARCRDAMRGAPAVTTCSQPATQAAPEAPVDVARPTSADKHVRRTR